MPSDRRPTLAVVPVKSTGRWAVQRDGLTVAGSFETEAEAEKHMRRLWQGTLSGASDDGVAVKALEWEPYENGLHSSMQAETIVGNYTTVSTGAAYLNNRLINPGNGTGRDIDSAKAAAQADYERRIHSALAPAKLPGTICAERAAVGALREPMTAFPSEIEPGVWYVGDKYMAHLKTEVGVGTPEKTARLAAEGINLLSALSHSPTSGDRKRGSADVALREAAHELADLMDEVMSGNYKPDSFTTQPIRAALASLDQPEDRKTGSADGALTFDEWSLRARSKAKPEFPLLTELLYRVCDNDPAKFQIATEIMRVAYDAALAHRPTSDGRDAEFERGWRHKKRGSTYTEIGRGRVQSEEWEERNYAAYDNEDTHRSVDMAEVVIYRADEDGSLWVRPVDEFEDGRFERLKSALLPRDGGGA